MEAEYPNSFGYNPLSLSCFNDFVWSQNPDDVSCQQGSLGALLEGVAPPQSLATPPPPPKKKVQAFNCPRVFFLPNFNKSSPNLLSLQETLGKTMKRFIIYIRFIIYYK